MCIIFLYYTKLRKITQTFLEKIQRYHVSIILQNKKLLLLSLQLLVILNKYMYHTGNLLLIHTKVSKRILYVILVCINFKKTGNGQYQERKVSHMTHMYISIINLRKDLCIEKNALYFQDFFAI